MKVSDNKMICEDTEEQFKLIMAKCRDTFSKKLRDYGCAWRIMRPISVTDQILIKANRIRSLEVKGVSLVGEGIYPEFMAIVNYGTYGVETDLAWPLDAIFESLKDDIDNSKKAIGNGMRGGRGNRKCDSEGVSDEPETPLSDDGKDPFPNPSKGALKGDETPLSDDAKGGLQPAKPIPFHSIPKQSKTNHSNRARGAGADGPPRAAPGVRIANTITPEELSALTGRRRASDG